MQIEPGFQRDMKDVVAHLKSVGITGIMFIEIDRRDKGYSQKILFPTKHPVIATKASDIKKFTEGIDSIIDKLKELDIKGISSSLKESFDLMNKTIKDIRLEEISSDVKDSFVQIKSILSAERWNRIIDSIEDLTFSFANLSETGDLAIKRGERLIENADAGFSVLQQRLISTARDLESTASNLKMLTEALTDQPSRVLFNRPLQERKIETENSK